MDKYTLAFVVLEVRAESRIEPESPEDLLLKELAAEGFHSSLGLDLASVCFLAVLQGLAEAPAAGPPAFEAVAVVADFAVQAWRKWIRER